MRKRIYVIFLLVLTVLGCSESEESINIISEDPNITVESLSNKSGGVYFAATPAGEYIFRLSLKNGNSDITCKMFHNDAYTELSFNEASGWEPGEVLDKLVFANDNLQLLVSIQEDGTEALQLIISGNEKEVVSFKSISNKPVHIYSGYCVSYHTKEQAEESADYTKEMMVVENNNYFYGLDPDNDGSYFQIHSEFKEKTSSYFTYDVPDVDDTTWERADVQYDKDLIHWSYEDDNVLEYFYTELNLYRRFQD